MGLLAAALACAAAAAPPAGAERAGQDELARPDQVRPGANIARVVFTTRATRRPGGGKVLARLRPVAPLGGGPTRLRIVGQKVVRGELFVRVLLAQRPNGARGWIPDDDVLLLKTRYRLWINRANRTLTVTSRGVKVRRFRIVVGTPSSPTPAGEYAISEKLHQSPPDSFLGTWIFPLTAFSGTYREFDGGPGRVALHGRAGTSLLDPLGSAASHGCIRMDNRAIAWIARRVPAGAAVIIR